MVINTIVISASSDIGLEIAKFSKSKNKNVIGTYRNDSSKVFLDKYCDNSINLDLKDNSDLDNFVNFLREKKFLWDELIFCPSQPFPFKSFFESEFTEWEDSFKVNSIYQLRILKALYEYRANYSKVVFFSGGGSNVAVDKLSAYTSAKIHLVKMVELLDFENEDMCFSIIGPGWVKTKTHLLALSHADKDSDKYRETSLFLESPSGATPITEVVRSVDWLLNQEKEIVGGRNFSTAYDPWGQEHPNNKILKDKLRIDKNMYKLRRSGNNIFTEKRY